MANIGTLDVYLPCFSCLSYGLWKDIGIAVLNMEHCRYRVSDHALSRRGDYLLKTAYHLQSNFSTV